MCLFSGSEYLTANLYFFSIFTTYFTLKQHMDRVDEYMKHMASVIFEKFEKYCYEFSVLLTMVVILDPFYKLKFLE